MDKKETENGNYYFKIDDADVNQSIIDAVAYVTGKDPLDMEPLHDVVDGDSLPALLDHRMEGHVSFQMEGVEVTITGSDEIVIEDLRETATLHEQLDGASSVLLLASAAAEEACIELLSAAPPTHETVLIVTFAQSAYDRLQVWESYANEDSAAGTVISMGGVHTLDSHRLGWRWPGIAVFDRAHRRPDGSGALGIRISEHLSTWAATDTQPVACVHSLGPTGTG